MFSLQQSSDSLRRVFCGEYVHAKIIICDDEFAVIGSANADDRGYTYGSEVVAGVTDDPFGRLQAQKFARDLRINLWHKHLGLPQSSLVDWRTALKYWFNPGPEAMVSDRSALEEDPLLGFRALSEDVDADRQWREIFDPDADLLPLASR
jgi:phosphatidylserine/phosphatidylglycerophosphate/cardiolipin synthase-like enzyme